jgi:hypothetical protein
MYSGEIEDRPESAYGASNSGLKDRNRESVNYGIYFNKFLNANAAAQARQRLLVRLEDEFEPELELAIGGRGDSELLEVCFGPSD